MSQATLVPNRINTRMADPKKVLSIYFTAGYPEKEDTTKVLQQLQDSGVDLVEIGLPFSDPLADGPTIQDSSTTALKNGMSTQLLFDQLKDIRKSIHIPLIVMGYFNPMLQYGVDAFLKECAQIGIDGIIMPDLPLAEYKQHYAAMYEKYGIKNIFLITPQTSDARIREIDKASDSFIYLVSTASVTGSKSGFGPEQEAYFERIANMKLKNPLVVGFGIHDAHTFTQATKHTSGAIIGSAFIKTITEKGLAGIAPFIQSLRPE
ncbi:tryptophan synthase, alpha subunit [Flavobacteria bacterium MS024-3C]|jgi:tryptophan synthase alpha chain|nr:tryptophan synthase, alpha subunit [Flavobacteria bacterium MS024-3C]KRO81607.1 MAG: tryptophan synthase subunit alpha [Polaribacter sp. BACL8 MAG-120531-bin13]MBT4840440.1 tryptophan synthase subunit alpha [Flavobacteriaceae bacterium]NQV63643.1 tryptophan synthase subunit alpha [Cryomorphaceae bacterium]MBT5394351.1 tryptophan synthase subunit alpha [Flavobacteriaceae bacterium]